MVDVAYFSSSGPQVHSNAELAIIFRINGHLRN